MNMIYRLFVLALLAGCGFSWDGPAEVRYGGEDQQVVIQCRGLTTLQGNNSLRCKFPNSEHLDIPWHLVRGIRTL